MESKKFLVVRVLLILCSFLALCYIEYYQSNIINTEKQVIEENNTITEEVVIEASKIYMNNKEDYFSDLLKDKIEIRINTDDLVKEKLINNNNDFKGYIKIVNNEYTFVKNTNLLINNIRKEEYKTNSNNEKEPYDLKYVYKGDDPNNYIKYNDKTYRIIGITNSNDFKIVSTENTVLSKWGLSGDINYLKTDKVEENDTYKGIFYVGYVRSETNDISSIIKNEKRNNTYTVSSPKYIGEYSYINISDIINAADECDYNKITNININNCHSYLIDMHSNSFTSISLENNMVYKINDKKEIVTSKLEENINVKKVLYLSGYEEYSRGNGTKENPYEIK